MLLTEDRTKEEWPSEKWNFQDNYGKTVRKVHAKSNPRVEREEAVEGEDEISTDESEESTIVLTEKKIKKLLTSVKGIGKKKSKKILKKFDTVELIETLEEAPEKLKEEFSWFKKKVLIKLMKQWESFKNKL